MKSIFGYAGTKDTDAKILNLLDDQDVLRLHAVNRMSHNFLSSDSFWRARCFHKFELVPTELLSKCYMECANPQWKTYYLQLAAIVRSKRPFFEAAQAKEAKRKDITRLLQLYREVKVTRRDATQNATREVYYVRACPGSKNGMREGYCTRTSGDGKNKQITLYRNNRKVTEKRWRNDKMHTMVRFKKNGDIFSEIKLDVKGNLLKLIRHFDASITFVKRWIKTQKVIEEGYLDDGQKVGIWIKTFKEGKIVVDNIIKQVTKTGYKLTTHRATMTPIEAMACNFTPPVFGSDFGRKEINNVIKQNAKARHRLGKFFEKRKDLKA